MLMILRQNSNLSRLARISLCTIIDQDVREAVRDCSLERTLELRKLMLERKLRLSFRNGA